MKIKKTLSILIFIGLIIWLTIYIYTNINDFKQINIVDYHFLFYLFILGLFTLMNNGLILKYLVEPFRIKLSKKEWFGLAIITTLGNYLTPFRGGAGARAVYLKKKYYFSYSYFLGTLAAIYIIIFLINSFIGIGTLIFLYYYYNMFSILIFTLFLAIFLSLLSIIIFSPKLSKTKSSFLNKFVKVINGWHLIKSNKKVIYSTSLLSILNVFIIALMVYFEFRVFGVNINFIKSLFIAVISYLSLFISITPGSLGIKEALIVFSSKVIGVSTAQAISIALLDRIIFLTIVFILGPIFSYILLKKVLPTGNNKENETNI